MNGLIVDLFAGFGGASTGIEAATGQVIDIAINHDPIAIACHESNHPQTRHITTDIFDVDPLEVTQGSPVDILWASPDCTHFSRAKGGKPKSKGIRSLAWVVTRWARDTRPEQIFMENVIEFRDWGPLLKSGHPDPKRKGETFKQFIGDLRSLGYQVEHRALNAADFGAPTARTRLFIIARRDGEPICWPTPTHGPKGDQPYNTAADCIDWSIPCQSVFLTPAEVKEQGLRCRRPLAENTMKRIAEGVRRFVIEEPEPFIVSIDHHGSSSPCVNALDKPVGTIVTKNNKAIVVPTLIQTGYGEREGQAPRVPGLHKPLGTICAGGGKHGLVAASLTKYYGTSIGNQVSKPLSTVCGGGFKHGLVAALLTKHYGGVVGHELKRPMGTITATDHHAVTMAKLSSSLEDRSDRLYAFMVKYYGTGCGSSLNEPVHTITSKDRMGLVTVHGQAYRIVDIGMRMLEPHELLRAQFGAFADQCSIDEVRTKRDKIRLIGNSVCPEVAEAVVRVNVPQLAEVAA